MISSVLDVTHVMDSREQPRQRLTFFSSTVMRFSSGLMCSISLYASTRSGQSEDRQDGGSGGGPAPAAGVDRRHDPSVAAVVSPRMDSPSRMIAPAPSRCL